MKKALFPLVGNLYCHSCHLATSHMYKVPVVFSVVAYSYGGSNFNNSCMFEFIYAVPYV